METDTPSLAATEATPEEEQRILDSQKSHLPMSIEPPSTTPAGVDNKAEAPGFPEDKINLVMGMGYTRQDAIEALSVADGNADGAVAYLLERR